MKLTNKANLPEAVVEAVRNDPYTKGDSDFSVTELLKPPRIVALEKKHRDEISEDAADRLWSLYGQMAHAILERANRNDLAEKRFFASFGEYKVSAQIDNLALKDDTLTDYKFQTVYKFKPDTPPDADWIAQLNVQAEILRQNGFDPKKLQIVGLLRDWSKMEARRNPTNYPQTPIVTVPIPTWTPEATQSFIMMRIALHKAAQNSLPECTPDERWAKPDTWAVVKGKRAIPGGVQFSKETAEAIAAKNPGTFVQYRPGESVRCAAYCSVSQFCTQYQNSIAKTETKK